MADEIRVNGNVHSWGSITVKVDGDPFHGFTSIGYGDARERSKVYGMGRHHAPRGRTRGKYTTDPVTIKGPKSSVDALCAALAQRSTSGTSYGDVPFQIVVQFTETEETPITVEIEDCVITKISASHEEGPDVLVDEIEADCMKIRRNGKVLFDESEGSP